MTNISFGYFVLSSAHAREVTRKISESVLLIKYILLVINITNCHVLYTIQLCISIMT